MYIPLLQYAEMKYCIQSLDWILLEMIKIVRFSWINLSIMLCKRNPRQVTTKAPTLANLVINNKIAKAV